MKGSKCISSWCLLRVRIIFCLILYLELQEKPQTKIRTKAVKCKVKRHDAAIIVPFIEWLLEGTPAQFLISVFQAAEWKYVSEVLTKMEKVKNPE